MIDRELRGRMKSILVRLWLLAEGFASSALRGVEISAGGSEMSRAPRRADLESLYEHWAPQLLRAAATGDAEKLTKACLDAETALAEHLGRYKPEMELPTDDKVAMERVARLYEGVSSIEVARRLVVSPGWVKTARRKNRRKADTGEPLEGWYGWDDAKRTSEIRKLRERGWTQEKIAAEFGISQQTISKYWGHAIPSAA